MSPLLDAFVARLGRVSGHGIDQAERPFHGELTLEALPGLLGVTFHFVAVGIDGSVYRDERGWIAPDDEGQIALWCMHAGGRGVSRHDLRNGAPQAGVTAKAVFGRGNPADPEHPRVEIVLELWADGDVGYRRTEGVAEGPFVPQWALRMSPSS